MDASTVPTRNLSRWLHSSCHRISAASYCACWTQVNRGRLSASAGGNRVCESERQDKRRHGGDTTASGVLPLLLKAPSRADTGIQSGRTAAGEEAMSIPPQLRIRRRKPDKIF